MNTFSKEAEIAYMEICNDIEISKDLSEISYLEEGGNPPRSHIELAINKLVALIDKAISKIKDFFTGKRTKDSIDKIEKAINKDPSLRNKKIKIKNYDKLRKLQDDTFDKVDKCKTSEDVNKLRKFYQEHKKIIIGAGAVTMVSVASILAYLKSGKSKDEDRLKHKKANIGSYSDEIVKIKEDKINYTPERTAKNMGKYFNSMYKGEKIKIKNEIIKDIIDMIDECENLYGTKAIKDIMAIESRYVDKPINFQNDSERENDIKRMKMFTTKKYPENIDESLHHLKIIDPKSQKKIVKKYTK